MKSVLVKEDIKWSYGRLGDWLMVESGREAWNTVSYEKIAKEFKRLRDLTSSSKAGRPVTEEELRKVVSETRSYLESHHKTTLYNVRGQGYKIATPEEVALYTAKFFKRTILYADRTYRLVEIVDRKYIPSALRTVFCDNEGRIKSLSLKGKKFLGTFVSYLREEEKKKLLEDKSVEEKVGVTK